MIPIAVMKVIMCLHLFYTSVKSMGAEVMQSTLFKVCWFQTHHVPQEEMPIV